MKLRIVSFAAFLAVAAAPAFSQGMMSKTVGGAPMYPSKNIVENAVNSKDHTTLVAAVKAAGLADTLRRGSVHGVRPDQQGLRQAARGHRRDPGAAGEQGRSPAFSPTTWWPGG